MLEPKCATEPCSSSLGCILGWARWSSDAPCVEQDVTTKTGLRRCKCLHMHQPFARSDSCRKSNLYNGDALLTVVIAKARVRIRVRVSETMTVLLLLSPVCWGLLTFLG